MFFFFMFAGALYFVWCSGTSKADFFDLGLVKVSSSFLVQFLGTKSAKKSPSTIKYQIKFASNLLKQ